MDFCGLADVNHFVQIVSLIESSSGGSVHQTVAEHLVADIAEDPLVRAGQEIQKDRNSPDM